MRFEHSILPRNRAIVLDELLDHYDKLDEPLASLKIKIINIETLSILKLLRMFQNQNCRHFVKCQTAALDSYVTQ